MRARKLGFAPEDWDVKLAKSGRVDISLVLAVRMPMLDTVTIRADRKCPEFTLEGFVCRRQSGGGVFMDYTEIDDKEAIYTADLFRDLKGFRETVRSTRDYGPIRVVQTSPPWGCVKSLVNGREASRPTRFPNIRTISSRSRFTPSPTPFRRSFSGTLGRAVTSRDRAGAASWSTGRSARS